MNNLIVKQLIKNSFDIPLQVTYPNGKTEIYNGDNPQVKIKFNKKISVTNLSKNASIVLGEAIMDGDIEIEGSIQELIVSAYRIVSWKTVSLFACCQSNPILKMTVNQMSKATMISGMTSIVFGWTRLQLILVPILSTKMTAWKKTKSTRFITSSRNLTLNLANACWILVVAGVR